ncbi:MAG: RNA methyltransferase [Myxococcales bacterium]|nr:RNA methyltransferase [Myxococcales bacterium]
MAIFLALVHHPVLNRRGEVVATAITNVDLHDLARSGRTFGASAVYIVTPVTLQQRMVDEVVGHWTQGQGSRHERRADAMRRLCTLPSLDAVRVDVRERTGRAPVLVMTGARMQRDTTPFAELRERLGDPNGAPIVVVFGTGWGLAPSVVATADLRLPPVGRAPAFDALDGSPAGPRYNHLSVRAAAAIVLDRLTGDH